MTAPGRECSVRPGNRPCSNGLGLGLLNHAACLGITLFDVLLEHLFLNPPLAAATHLDCLQFAAADEGIRCRRIDLKLLGDICKRKETWHSPIVPPLVAADAVIHSLMLFA